MPILDPKGVALLVSFFRPLRAAILPNLSITAFSAIDAKAGSCVTGESCVLRPLKPGAPMYMF
jgi:hypothetical protein